MPSPNEDVVRRQWEALERGGIDAAAEYWHPEISWRAVEGEVDDVGEIRGRAAMRRYYQDWLDTIEDLSGGIEKVLYDSGDHLIAVLYSTGRGRGSSIPMQGRYHVLYTIRSGLIVRGREYAKREQAFEALERLQD
jgi:ketosteroid isomerase-like protein